MIKNKHFDRVTFDLDLKINYYTKITFLEITKQILTQSYFYWYGPSQPSYTYKGKL